MSKSCYQTRAKTWHVDGHVQALPGGVKEGLLYAKVLPGVSPHASQALGQISLLQSANGNAGREWFVQRGSDMVDPRQDHASGPSMRNT
jgi:hypothetical protein